MDLSDAMPPEPPEGRVGLINVRVRLPDGERVTRRFNSTDRVEVRVVVPNFTKAPF